MGNTVNIDRYYSAKEAARILSVQPRRAIQMIEENKIKGIKFVHYWLIEKKSVTEFLEAKTRARGKNV